MAEPFEKEFKLKKGRKGKSHKSDVKSFINKSGIKSRFTNPQYVKNLYSGKSEVVVKVAGYKRGFEVKNNLEYISRIDNDKKPDLECEDELSSKMKGKKEIYETYDRWKEKFEKYPKRGLKRKKRDSVHLILSSDCKMSEENSKKVLHAARSVIAEEFGDKGFEHVSALHRDSNTPHVHFAINCHNRFEDKSKLRLNQSELFKIRTKFAENLTELGLDHVATMRRDRPNIIKLVHEGVEQLKRDEKQFQRAMRRASPTRDAFLYRKNASKTIVRIREQIKAKTEQKSEIRLDLMNKLRAVERKLTKTRPDIEKEIAASFNKYDQELNKYKKSVPRLDEIPQDRKEDKYTDRLLKSNKMSFDKNIHIAKEYIKNSDAEAQIKKDSLFVLDQYQKDMNLSYGIKLKSKDINLTKSDSQEPKKPISGDFKDLKDTIRQTVELKAKEPGTARKRLQKTRELDRLSKEFQNKIEKARKEIKKTNISPDRKNTDLKNLRKIETDFNNRMAGKKVTNKEQQTQRPGKSREALKRFRQKQQSEIKNKVRKR